MNNLIREMALADCQQVQEVARKSWNSTYKGIIPEEVQENFLTMAYNDEMLEKRLNHSLILVAEVENRIVGFANFSAVNPEGEAELTAIYLYPEYKGKGIGTALLQNGIASLNDPKRIYANVEKENISGRAFYNAKGFQTIQEFDDDFDGHILKTVRMVASILEW